MAASKVQAIKDEVVLRLAKSIVQPTQEWTGQHQARLIWGLFRSMGFNPGDAGSEPFKKAVQTWESYWNNASLGYSSNTAKRLAESGICAKDAEVIAGEYK